MNIFEATGTSSGSKALGIGATLRASMLVGALLVSPSLSTSSEKSSVDGARLARSAMQTSPGLPVETRSRRTASATLAELRRLSGFTWDQLSRLFGVTRRAIHFWASGQALSAPNEERLHRTLATIRQVDRGSAQANRSAFLSALPDGQIAFDLLVEGKHSQVVAALGWRPSAGSAPVASPIDRRTYESLSPADLLGAVADDIVPIETGKLRGARSFRVKSVRQ